MSHQAKASETMDRLTHTPTTNDVYKDARSGTLKRIYIDSEIVFTRSEQTKRNSDRHIHNMIEVEKLKNKINQDRFEYKPDADPDIPKFDPKYADEDSPDLPSETAIGTEDTTEEGTSTESTTQPDDQVDLTSISTADTTENKGDTDSEPESADNSSTEQMADENKVSWKTVPLIGEKTQDRLYENGYVTTSDVESATSDELIDVKGIGEKAAKNLKTHVTDN